MTLSGPSHEHAHSTWVRWIVLPLILGATTVLLISRTEKQQLDIAIAVTFNNLADNLMLMEAPRQSVRLLVSGTPSDLESLASGETFCRLDLSDLGAGTHTIIVHPADIGLSRGVALKALLTPSLTIRLEALSQKTVDVVATLEGNPAPGFAVAEVSLEPDRIALKGTATLLNSINEVNTHPINLHDAAESFKKEIPLKLPETIASTPPHRLVVARVKVEPRIVSRTLEKIPVTGIGTSADHQIHPQTIALTISGPQTIVNAIETDPAFAVTVDLKDLAPGTHSLKAAIKLPVRTTLTSVNPERFTVTIN